MKNDKLYKAKQLFNKSQKASDNRLKKALLQETIIEVLYQTNGIDQYE